MIGLQQLIAELLEGAKGASACIDLRAMFLCTMKNLISFGIIIERGII